MSPSPAADGILLVDKPDGWTSHDVVGRTRRLAGTRRVGHAGTLDPMATGLLVLGINKGTKLLTFLVGCDKDYTATIRLGQSTTTDDAEGEITSAAGASGLDPERISRAVESLTGDIEQVPSTVSAIKIDGRRAYARARAGEDVTLAARPVTVARFAVLDRRDTVADGVPVVDLDVAVTVSSGTYVRALARDLGAALGTGGHLTRLRRTRVGHFETGSAHTLDHLADLVERGEPLPILSLDEVARRSFTVRDLSAEEARALSFGARIPAVEAGRSEPVAGIDPDGRLIAILDESQARTRSRVVFAPATS
ncbi:MAG TPA: tRNA pseudouridine(55) synthase TruB [Intrasporangiaceae bacterium]|nr:tRNA pseudouridine(55) synthase TruB [Intrasporangiaceae bacterium]